MTIENLTNPKLDGNERKNKVRDIKVKGIEVLSICPFGEAIERHKHFHEYYGGTVSHYPPEIKY